jgi:lysophospholipase L1-like esterase
MSPARARPRRLALTALASFLVLAGSLALAEVALRAAGLAPPPAFKLHAQLRGEADVAVPDVDLIYRLKPGTTLLGRYRINALGYRGPEVERERRADTLRVVATGDSSTFGLGVGEGEAWPFVLGRLLQARIDEHGAPRRVEVVDAGVPGYTTLQNREQIARDLMPLAPDVLVWCPMGHNDAARIPPPDELQRWQERRSLAGRLRRLALVYRLEAVLDPAPAAGSSIVPRVSLAQLEDNVRAVARLARDARVPLVLIAPPHDASVRAARPDEAAAEDRVVQVARSEGATLADPRAAIGALAGQRPFPDGVHPSPEAHALIAEHVLAALVDAHPGLTAPGDGE